MDSTESPISKRRRIVKFQSYTPDEPKRLHCAEHGEKGPLDDPRYDESLHQDQICFGMITDISIELFLPTALRCSSYRFLPNHKSLSIVTIDGYKIGAVLENGAINCLSALHREETISLQISITTRDSTQGRPLKSGARSGNGMLSVIIYGEPESFDDVGICCQEHDFYIQEPIGCDRNVKYKNPQTIAGTLDNNVPWTFDLQQKLEAQEQAQDLHDLLDGFQTTECLTESEQPLALKTILYRHQLQALTFMRRREQGWNFRYASNDVWSTVVCPNNTLNTISFLNNISGETQTHAPPMFQGGILADDMGLGKSITMMALIASDEVVSHYQEDLRATQATLLIVPSSLISQWGEQLAHHLWQEGPHSVVWEKHHASQRLADHTQLRKCRIVLTSYQTLVSEYRKLNVTPSILFDTKWHRLVLDEAHAIRNRQTATARAVGSLNSFRRWAVTGTPIQNRMSDFASLLSFLRVSPYDNRKQFEDDIVDYWKAGECELAIQRFKKLFNYIAIRRPRSEIQLPPRKDVMMRLEFSAEEQLEYRQLEMPIVKLLDYALHEYHSPPISYMNALVRINALRKFCNIGASAAQGNDSSPMPQRLALLEDLLSSGEASCVVCGTNIAYAMDSEDKMALPMVLLSDCLRFRCLVCSRESSTGFVPRQMSCEIHESCSFKVIDDEHETFTPNHVEEGTSTKIKSLISDLAVTKHEKSVIFSAWTSTLDTIQQTLDVASIRYARISGNVPPTKRARILDRFSNDVGIQCILITIACGAEGLNLTAASRVYLMEPQWNPNIEEQALARVHRLGQTRSVTTVRFIMCETIENHVVDIQDRKKRLADLLSSQQVGGLAESQHRRLQTLRDLLN